MQNCLVVSESAIFFGAILGAVFPPETFLKLNLKCFTTDSENLFLSDSQASSPKHKQLKKKQNIFKGFAGSYHA